MAWYYMTKENSDKNKPCEICKKPVKVGETFYMGQSNDDLIIARATVIHARCEWKRVEKERVKPEAVNG